jgi:deazaflavin-dependent oxidoreductase (nitroreductase family)
MSFNDQIIGEFRANGGEVPRFGRSLILLHHIGAKSAVERVSPVMGLPSDAGWLIAASKGGSDENPAWYHNLLAHPEVTIETPDDAAVAVRAVELARPERDAAWSRFTAASPGFASYEQRTRRVIPVIELRRR